MHHLFLWIRKYLRCRLYRNTGEDRLSDRRKTYHRFRSFIPFLYQRKNIYVKSHRFLPKETFLSLKERLWGNICVWSSSGRETYPSLYTISLLKEIQWIVWTVVNTFGIGFLVLIKNIFQLLKLFILFTTIH